MTDSITIRDPSAQLNAWVNNNKQQYDFWKTVVDAGNHSITGKTREEAVTCRDYFEGRYDLACQMRDFILNRVV